MPIHELEFDTGTLNKMERAFFANDHQAQVGDYWRSYVASILEVMRKYRLSGFGDNYFLTQGFGDSLKYHATRVRIRKLLRSPKLYAPIEKALVIRSQKARAKTLHANHKSLFASTEFASSMARQLDGSTRSLGISRYVEIDGHWAPWRYWMFLVYLEMLQHLASGAGIDTANLLAGNYLDIGGGYGSSVDGTAMLKRHLGIGGGTINYDIDQFPVTFIANQYLKYRNPKVHLAPVVDLNDVSSLAHQQPNNETFTRVIQNNTVDHISGLGISFFFNSNSFQEMDTAQVEAYCEFMKRNSAQASYLGAYFYHSVKESNHPEKALAVLRRRFSSVASIDIENFFKARGVAYPAAGAVKGAYYLFKVK